MRMMSGKTKSMGASQYSKNPVHDELIVNTVPITAYRAYFAAARVLSEGMAADSDAGSFGSAVCSAR